VQVLNTSSQQSILYQTKKGTVIQDDGTCQFILEFQGRKTLFKVSEFLQFKKTLDEINLADLFLGEGTGIDVQIIHYRGSDHFFVLTLCELVALKDLMHGAMTMIALNRMVHDRLQAVIF